MSDNDDLKRTVDAEYQRAAKTAEGGTMKERGLYQKYTITKTDGTPIAPHAKYFVLRYDGYRLEERDVLFEYAEEMNNQELLRDLEEESRKWIEQWSEGEEA